MTVSIDSPVGVVRPNSWWRTTKATNYSRNQSKLVELFGAIPTSQGGKKGIWSLTAFVMQDGKCHPELAQAIWDFQVFWKAKGLFRNIDGVVDPGGNTLKKLNELASNQAPTDLIADIVIRFQGGSIEEPLKPDDVLPRSRIMIYQPMEGQRFGDAVLQHPIDDRALIRLGRRTNTIAHNSQGMFAQLTGELISMTGALKAKPGKIYIHGSSSGGRNAIDFAQRLGAAGPLFKPHFIAAVDAAFFDADSHVRPTVEGRDPGAVPAFRVSTPFAPLKHNFFQTLGNHSRVTRLGFGDLVFTSNMGHEEIHGQIEGFSGHNLDSLLTPGPSDDVHHVNCVSEGSRRVFGQIADDLLRGRQLPPNIG